MKILRGIVDADSRMSRINNKIIVIDAVNVNECTDLRLISCLDRISHCHLDRFMHELIELNLQVDVSRFC